MYEAHKPDELPENGVDAAPNALIKRHRLLTAVEM